MLINAEIYTCQGGSIITTSKSFPLVSNCFASSLSHGTERTSPLIGTEVSGGVHVSYSAFFSAFASLTFSFFSPASVGVVVTFSLPFPDFATASTETKREFSTRSAKYSVVKTESKSYGRRQKPAKERGRKMRDVVINILAGLVFSFALFSFPSATGFTDAAAESESVASALAFFLCSSFFLCNSLWISWKINCCSMRLIFSRVMCISFFRPATVFGKASSPPYKMYREIRQNQ